LASGQLGSRSTGSAMTLSWALPLRRRCWAPRSSPGSMPTA